MNKICCLPFLLLFILIQSCSRHKRIEIANNTSYDSLMIIVKANGKEVFEGKVTRPQRHFSPQVATFHYRGDSCGIEVDIPELNLTTRKSFADLEHDYIVITLRQLHNSQNDTSARKAQVLIEAVETVRLGAAE